MAETPKNIAHLKWAIESRARNQICALRLLTLFGKYESTWNSKKYARAAQDLVAVSFSLWRAAFLADKTSKRAAVFAHGRAFLKHVIEDNAISYLLDKNSREWTFNYYTRNARFSLKQLASSWKGVAAEFVDKTREPPKRWDYCQSLLDQAVANFETLLSEKDARRAASKSLQIARADKRRKRRTVRKLALAARQKI
jgi:hypothetical protein